MAYFVGLFILTFSIARAGELPQLTIPMNCKVEVARTLKNWGITPTWRKHVDPAPGGQAFQSPTKQFGTWVALHAFSDGVPRAFKISNTKISTANFNTETCAPEISEKVIVKDAYKAGRSFKDEDLKRLLDAKTSALIYIWTPGAVYSMREYKTFQSVAAKLKIKFVPILGQRTDPQEATRGAQNYKFPLEEKYLDSVEIAMVDGTVHFPTSFVISGGKLDSSPIIGAKPSADIERIINESMKKLGGKK